MQSRITSYRTDFKKHSSCIFVTIDTRNSLRDNNKQDKDSNSVEQLLLNQSGCNFSFKLLRLVSSHKASSVGYKTVINRAPGL